MPVPKTIEMAMEKVKVKVKLVSSPARSSAIGCTAWSGIQSETIQKTGGKTHLASS
jgi:hypothetical protein